MNDLEKLELLPNHICIFLLLLSFLLTKSQAMVLKFIIKIINIKILLKKFFIILSIVNNLQNKEKNNNIDFNVNNVKIKNFCKFVNL